MIAAVAQCWHGTAQGGDENKQLEEGRWKHLLSPMPPGFGAAAEVHKRLTLWEERRFEELLQRAEDFHSVSTFLRTEVFPSQPSFNGYEAADPRHFCPVS